MRTDLFPITSRYYTIATAELVTPAGKKIVYLRRRFVPPVESFVPLQEHRVTQGDRVDNIAALHLGDPEQFWRLCDANGVIQPEELTQAPGQVILITLPEGIPGVTHA